MLQRIASRARTIGAFVFGAAVVLSACDSGGDGNDDPFVGTWAITGLAINGEDQTALLRLLDVESMGATFSTDGDFELTVVTDSGSTTTRGTYALDEETITFSSDAFEEPLVLDFQASGSNTIVLSADDAALLSELSGFDLSRIPGGVETIALTISRQE